MKYTICLVILFSFFVGLFYAYAELVPAAMTYKIDKLYTEPDPYKGVNFEIPGNITIERLDAVIDDSGILWVKLRVRNSLLIKVDSEGWVEVARLTKELSEE